LHFRVSFSVNILRGTGKIFEKFSLQLAPSGSVSPRKIFASTTLNNFSKNMKIESLAFAHNELIPPKYTCDGESISPPLHFIDVPSQAQSLVLIMDDPDIPEAAKQSYGIEVWDHWTVFNIPPTTQEVSEGTNPAGVLGKNTRGNTTYGSPCPPDREHRYFFKLYALDTMLDLKEGATKHEVELAMQGHIIAQAGLIGKYNRKK